MVADRSPARRTERRKAYKACEPFDTVLHARRLLHSCDLFTIEAHRSFDAPGVRCCRVLLGGDDVAGLQLGTNGKGLTRRYALASAYGELLERLQSSALFPLRQLRFATRRYLAACTPSPAFGARLDRDGLVLDFLYAPDEVCLEHAALVDECPDVLSGLLGVDGAAGQTSRLSDLFGDEPVTCVPFYSVRERRQGLLPADLLGPVCGTNGMCAGTTPHEVLVQGVCEVFERFSLRMLYLDDVTPPEIPLDVFSGSEVHERLRRLEESTGVAASVRDCSLGLDRPVVGLMLRAPAAGKYAFHLGADACPTTALMRCLTEVFQGQPDDVQRRFHVLPELRAQGADDDWDRAARFRAFHAMILTGSGAWPSGVLGAAGTYAIDGFRHPVSFSDADDLEHLTGFVPESGRDLLVRDVSYLGFPAYQVYVPGMSEVDYLTDDRDLKLPMDIERSRRTLLDLKHADEPSIAELAAAVAAVCSPTTSLPLAPHRWFLSTDDDELRALSAPRLLALLRARLGEFGAAADAMDRDLCVGATDGTRLEYVVARDYWRARSEGLDAAAAEERLVAGHGEALGRRIAAEIVSPERLFDHAPWPTCFDCDSCPVEDSCAYFAVLRRVRTLQDRYLANTPDQRALAAVVTSPIG